jgi:hypothetical protein
MARTSTLPKADARLRAHGARPLAVLLGGACLALLLALVLHATSPAGRSGVGAVPVSGPAPTAVPAAPQSPPPPGR